MKEILPRLKAATPVRHSARSRGVTFAGLLYVLAVVIALAGGWYAYGAVHRALTVPSTSPQKGHHQALPPAVGPATAAPAHRGRAASGCSIGPVRLVRIWADQLHPVAGAPATFEYTVENDATACRPAALSLSAISDTRPGLQLAAPPGATVRILPGTHTYLRRFTFPSSAAGQSFDILWTVAGPNGGPQYGQIRVNHLITIVA